jgi:NADH:ubiquinone oxidoreductase subunit F (NADH-binding)
MVDVARYYIKFLSEESCGNVYPVGKDLKTCLKYLREFVMAKA